jgi:hypothetical protein
MQFTKFTTILILATALAPASLLRGDETRKTDFQPDPLSVQRFGQGYRYPQAGWIVLHVEGDPYERGYQHGRLMAPEITAFVRSFAIEQSPTAPADGWRITRTLTNSLFLRRYDREYLEEMKGIADGAAAAGARFEGRTLDLVDIAALNAREEIETLDSALEALPTGLEGVRFPYTQPRATPAPKPMHCSAFAANGPATVDGKIVFGHITMSSLHSSYHYNVWIDVKPTKGHRVLMQSYPGGIQSGLDYYMNDAGLLITETTIAQTKYDIQGASLASRIRQAMQYADSIDQAVEILKKANNGLYTNEWLLADVKTNEIAMFELGTAKSKLYRSSRNEWVGGTDGFYWGCNNTKDRDVRLETIPGVHGRPENVCFCPTDRDKVWVRLYEKHKGKIDERFGKLAFTTPPIAAYSSLDAKFTTTELAKDLKTWALFGPPLGRSWQPTLEERKRYPDIQPLISNPWAILHANPPAPSSNTPLAVDLPDPNKSSFEIAQRHDGDRAGPTKPAWHGTLLPKTDADVWLAAAFPAYERIVASSKREGDQEKTKKPTNAQRERLAVELNAHRSGYLASARAGADVPLMDTRSQYSQSNWYTVAEGKGVLFLQELRRRIGDSRFEEAMDSFGRQHAGKEVTSAGFQAHVERATGTSLSEFFDYWLKQPGLPKVRLENASVASKEKGYKVEGEIVIEGKCPTSTIEVAVETGQGDEFETVQLKGSRTPFSIETKHKPRRVVIDKYGETAKANGDAYTVLRWYEELENTLIVYGTRDEEATNKEAAEDLQKAIIRAHSNFTVPIKEDRQVTKEDLETRHLLLIGRPDCNAVVERLKRAFPITFGARSFTVSNESYAHALTAVIAAGENPQNPRYSLVVIAGLSPEATLHAVAKLVDQNVQGAEVLVLPNRGKARALVVPSTELVKDFGSTGGAPSSEPPVTGGH